MNRFKRIETGTFKIDALGSLGWGESPKAILVKNGEKFAVKLKSLRDQVIGKTEVEATIYLTQAGNWVIGPARNKITVKICKGCGKEVKRYACCDGYYNYSRVTRDKRVVEDVFTAISQSNHGRACARITLKNSTGEKFDCHLHDIFPELSKVYIGIPFKLREQSKSGVHVWVPVK